MPLDAEDEGRVFGVPGAFFVPFDSLDGAIERADGNRL
jgi:hypothetical protein